MQATSQKQKAESKENECLAEVLDALTHPCFLSFPSSFYFFI